MKVRSLFVGAVALALPFTAIACSDDSSGDYSESEIIEELTDVGVPESIAKCAAPKLKALDFSNDDINEDGTPKTEKGEKAVAAITDCATEGLSDISVPDDIELPEDIELPSDSPASAGE